MDTEDDMIVLVVVDDEKSTDGSFPLPMIKQEPESSSGESMKLDDIIETAEKHGEFVAVKIEPADFECDHLEDEILQTVLKPEPTDEEYVDNDDSQDYIPDEDDDAMDSEEYVKEDRLEVHRNNKHRFTMLKPWQQRSFVAELRQEYAELRNDEELLINTLEQIMRSVKPPLPPRDFYIMNGILFECVHCGTLSETIPAAGRHFQEKHGQRYLVCYACGVDFRSTTNLYKHEKRCVAPDAHVVLKARAACVGRKGRGRPYLGLNSHDTKSERARFPCQLCSAVFMTRSNLQSHENLHRGERPFRCHVCPCAYTSYSALSRHTKKHMDVQFICDLCNRAFKIKAALVSHMDTHKPIRKHGCNECSRRFAQKSALLLHIDRVHRNLPPPCACQICPKRYPRMSLLKAHMKRAHGMSIITRKMFFKSLPTMSELEVKQSKVILKSDRNNFEYAAYQTEDFGHLKEESIDNEDHSQDVDCVKLAEQMFQTAEQNITDEQSQNNCLKLAEQMCQQSMKDEQGHKKGEGQSLDANCIKIEIPEGSDACIGDFLQYIQRVNNEDGHVEFVQYQGSDSKHLGPNVIYIENGEIVQQVGAQENLILEVEAMVDGTVGVLHNLNGERFQAIVKSENLG